MPATSTSGLTAITTLAATDLIEVSQDAGGSSFTSKKITLANFKTALLETLYSVTSFGRSVMQAASAAAARALILPTLTGNGSRLVMVNSGGTDIEYVDGMTNSSGLMKLKVYTVATLPSAATVGAYTIAAVSDANSTTFNATAAGGGSNKMLVMSDGTNWKLR